MARKSVITANEIKALELQEDVIQDCKEHPVQGFDRASTGQLKALGNASLRHLLEVSEQAYHQQEEAAQELGVTYTYEDAKGQRIGLSPTVSLIRDDSVIRKRVIVPASQIYVHPQLDAHQIVAFFVRGTKTTSDELDTVMTVYAAGWIDAKRLRRWVRKGGAPPFTTQHASLAIAPCDVLNPIDWLLENSHWSRICL